MKFLNLSNSLKYFFFVSISFLIVVGIFPGSGGEGAQRELEKLSQKRDWWNFATAALYGMWPDSKLPWTYTLTLFQLSLYLLGVWLILMKFKPGINRKVFFIISVLGAMFVVQLWRDATLLALQTFSIALLVRVRSFNSRRDFFFLFFGILLNLLGSMFKPFFAPISALIFLLLLTRTRPKMRTQILIGAIAILLAVLPFLTDKQLSQRFNLVKSYPEQQVLIYDLSKLYCWGYSPAVIEESKRALSPLLSTPNNYEAVCASLSPTGWDALRVQIPEVKSSPALTPLVETQGDEVQALFKSWIRILMTNPVDWIMTKSSDVSQVLLMANAYHAPDLYSKNSKGFLTESGNVLLKILYAPILFLDKIRIFSLGFTLSLALFLIYRNRMKNDFSSNDQKVLFKFLAINVLILAFGSLSFIANNGRYVLPYILLSYFYLLLSREKEST